MPNVAKFPWTPKHDEFQILDRVLSNPATQDDDVWKGLTHVAEATFRRLDFDENFSRSAACRVIELAKAGFGWNFRTRSSPILLHHRLWPFVLEQIRDEVLRALDP